MDTTSAHATPGLPPGFLASSTATEGDGALDFPWGRIAWLFNGELSPGSEMTFGHVVIGAGERNPVHSHDCEEILYLLDGVIEHSLGDQRAVLEPGDAIRIPAGERHNAVNLGDGPATMVIAYSRPERGFTAHE